jgi:hypothetical protein
MHIFLSFAGFLMNMVRPPPPTLFPIPPPQLLLSKLAKQTATTSSMNAMPAGPSKTFGMFCLFDYNMLFLSFCVKILIVCTFAGIHGTFDESDSLYRKWGERAAPPGGGHRNVAMINQQMLPSINTAFPPPPTVSNVQSLIIGSSKAPYRPPPPGSVLPPGWVSVFCPLLSSCLRFLLAIFSLNTYSIFFQIVPRSSMLGTKKEPAMTAAVGAGPPRTNRDFKES